MTISNDAIRDMVTIAHTLYREVWYDNGTVYYVAEPERLANLTPDDPIFQALQRLRAECQREGHEYGSIMRPNLCERCGFSKL